MLVLRGILVTPFEVIERGQIEILGSEIKYAGVVRGSDEAGIDYGNAYIVPGFIDIHVHGLNGYDSNDKDPESIQCISESLAAKGVTGFLPTIQTAPLKEIHEALKRVKDSLERGVSGAAVLGSHLEGPFISPERIGAQQQFIQKPSIKTLEGLLDASGGSLRLVTLAPELETGLEAVKFLVEKGVVVSAGHTDASYDEACKAFDAGLNSIGHFWNGMRGLHHREPGIVGAGLMDADVFVELIADCCHVHPAVLGLTMRLKGVDRIVLVSDSIKPAGLPDGEYSFGGRNFYLKDNIIKLDSGVIAGSSTSLNKAVQNMIEKAGATLSEAIQMATDTPARLLEMKKGRLEPGYDADITIMDSDYNVIETIVMGKTVYRLEGDR